MARRLNDPGQPSLLRAHDLPPIWDGRLITWRGWEGQPDVFICPPPKIPDCCRLCGSIERPIANTGLVATSPTITREQLDDDIENRRRLGSLAWRRARIDWLRLRVFRCVDCKHDVVWDTDTDEWWDLDDTDYTDNGSSRPI